MKPVIPVKLPPEATEALGLFKRLVEALERLVPAAEALAEEARRGD
jgi:hypothetical protein